MDINNLLRQHQDILDLAGSIRTYCDNRKVTENAAQIAKELSQLAGILRIHLSSEDRFVYPHLAVHQDQQVQTTSRLFASEMGELADLFNAYKVKYQGANRISDNAEQFVTETKQITDALVTRITRENRELYPLLG